MELDFRVVSVTETHNEQKQIVVCPKMPPRGNIFPFESAVGWWRSSVGSHQFPRELHVHVLAHKRNGSIRGPIPPLTVRPRENKSRR